LNSKYDDAEADADADADADDNEGADEEYICARDDCDEECSASSSKIWSPLAVTGWPPSSVGVGVKRKDRFACVYRPIMEGVRVSPPVGMTVAGRGGMPLSGSSFSSSVELHAEKELWSGGRTGGMLMADGASEGLLEVFLGDCGGVRSSKEKSGHERGETTSRPGV
jgi:hypothetical protein